jgi:DNA-binding SARP family transcriptional activator
MRFRVLGPLEVRSQEGWTGVSAPKWRSLLACLLPRPRQLVPAEVLIDELWGPSPPGKANNLLSIYVHRLRKVIGDPEGRMLVFRAPGYLLRTGPGDVDLEMFESLTGEGRSALAVGDHERAAALLAEALGLWRGPVLADVVPSPMLAAHAERAAELRLAAAEARIEADTACGRTSGAVAELRGLLADYPLRERLWALLIRALVEAGRRAEALDAYAQAQQVISDELGVDPGSELQAQYAELLAADASSSAASRPPRPQRARTTSGGGTGTASASGSGAVAETVTTAPGQAAAPGAAAWGETEPAGPGTIAIGTFAQLPGVTVTPAAGASRETGPEAVARPAQLPADLGDFTGREEHADHLWALLGKPAATGPGAGRIAVVNGAAGLGKTALAVHVAHRVAGEFPDGQLYADLRGASSQPANPGEVLARFLRDLGVEGDKVPARDDERAALYRTTLTGRRVLILLDNAKDTAQIRSLLPGSSSCAVLVTTRNRTSDLESSRFLDLNVLEDTEALALFTRIVGDERAAAEPDATAEVLVACAGLPLAIRICAARLAARRQWKIATLAARLRNEHRRLDELMTGDLAVRASFQVTYASLRGRPGGPDPARAFRLLGLWQGTSISLQAAAALLGEPDDEAAEALEALVDASLLESPAPDWYLLHDLLKFYATERAQAEEPGPAQDEAVSRLLWWYLGTAEAAADAVSPRRYQVPRETAAPGRPPLTFADTADALAWYDGERANVVAATRQAAAAGLHEVACRLPPTLFPLFSRRSNWADCVTVHRIAAQSAAYAGDRLLEAWALNALGSALASLRDPEAFDHLERALAARRELGDTRGEAQTAIVLGEGCLRMRGAGEDALRYLQHAADLLEPTDDVSLRSVALNNLGEAYFELGDVHAAAALYQRALALGGELSGARGYALINLGTVYTRLRRLDEAITSFSEALSVHRASGALGGEALALQSLGVAQAEAGARADARASLTGALRIFEQIGDQEQAAESAALLKSLPPGDEPETVLVPARPSKSPDPESEPEAGPDGHAAAGDHAAEGLSAGGAPPADETLLAAVRVILMTHGITGREQAAAWTAALVRNWPGPPGLLGMPDEPVGHPARAPASPVPDVPGRDLRPDPLTAETPAEFVTALIKLRQWANNPPYRKMAELCGGTVASATICTALTRDKDKLPSQEVVLAVVAACGGGQEQERAWTTAWRQLEMKQEPRRRRGKQPAGRKLYPVPDTG